MREIRDSESLHYMKNVPFSDDLKQLRRLVRTYCPFIHGKKIDLQCYEANEAMQYWLRYMEEHILCYEFLDIARSTTEEMKTIVSTLRHPGAMVYCSECFRQIKRFDELVKEVESEVQHKLMRLTCDECTRLDEAIVCYEYHCYYAAVIMAVSAIETRLHKLLEKADKSLYSSSFEKAPLGVLIESFDDSHYKKAKYQDIKKVLPQKHRPLLILLNHYRVFSAHPKKEEITAQIAGSVLNLTFAFMMDSALCPFSKRELACVKRRIIRGGIKKAKPNLKKRCSPSP
jgi:uncharacterized protein YaaR (DUF327 family)